MPAKTKTTARKSAPAPAVAAPSKRRGRPPKHSRGEENGRSQGGRKGRVKAAPAPAPRGRVFGYERDLREAVREWWPNVAHWVEAAPGATFGVPDAFLMGVERIVFAELKVGVISARGELVYTVRTAQRRFLAEAQRNRVPAVFIVGVQGERAAYVIPINTASLGGRWPIWPQPPKNTLVLKQGEPGPSLAVLETLAAAEGHR